MKMPTPTKQKDDPIKYFLKDIIDEEGGGGSGEITVSTGGHGLGDGDTMPSTGGSGIIDAEDGIITQSEGNADKPKNENQGPSNEGTAPPSTPNPPGPPAATPQPVNKPAKKQDDFDAATMATDEEETKKKQPLRVTEQGTVAPPSTADTVMAAIGDGLSNAFPKAPAQTQEPKQNLFKPTEKQFSAELNLSNLFDPAGPGAPEFTFTTPVGGVTVDPSGSGKQIGTNTIANALGGISDLSNANAAEADANSNYDSTVANANNDADQTRMANLGLAGLGFDGGNSGAGGDVAKSAPGQQAARNNTQAEITRGQQLANAEGTKNQQVSDAAKTKDAGAKQFGTAAGDVISTLLNNILIPEVSNARLEAQNNARPDLTGERRDSAGGVDPAAASGMAADLGNLGWDLSSDLGPTIDQGAINKVLGDDVSRAVIDFDPSMADGETLGVKPQDWSEYKPQAGGTQAVEKAGSKTSADTIKSEVATPRVSQTAEQGSMGSIGKPTLVDYTQTIREEEEKRKRRTKKSGDYLMGGLGDG
jgi:hypothetical protein